MGFRITQSYEVFSFNALPVNDRHHIKKSIIKHLKIILLSRSDFHGFNQLEELQIVNGLVSSINTDVFEELGALPGGTIASHHQPSVANLTIESNHSLHLDWGFLRPISGTLQVDFWIIIF